MKTWKTLALALIVMLGLTGFSIEKKADIRQTVVPLVVAMQGLMSDESGFLTKFPAYCSAVKLSPEFLLTAAHCADLVYGGPDGKLQPFIGREVLWHDTQTGTIQTGTISKRDESKDLMLIRVHTTCPCAPLAKKVTLDEDVIAVGFPMGDDINNLQVVTEGSYQGEVTFDRSIVTTPIIYGNSGGGVFNKQGELIGIVVEVVAESDGFSYSRPISHLAIFVENGMVRDFADGF